MTMKRHIELIQARGIKTLKVIRPEKEADSYPCPCCHGAGVIQEVIQYLRIDGRSSHITNSQNVPLSARTFSVCPACTGKGINDRAFLASVSSENPKPSEVA